MFTTFRGLQRKIAGILPADSPIVHSDYKDDGFADAQYDGDWQITCDTLDTVVHEGPARFELDGEVSAVIENPTVADAIRFMDSALRTLNDGHHIFYEGYALKAGFGPDGDGALIEIHTGS